MWIPHRPLHTAQCFPTLNSHREQTTSNWIWIKPQYKECGRKCRENTKKNQNKNFPVCARACVCVCCAGNCKTNLGDGVVVEGQRRQGNIQVPGIRDIRETVAVQHCTKEIYEYEIIQCANNCLGDRFGERVPCYLFQIPQLWKSFLRFLEMIQNIQCDSNVFENIFWRHLATPVTVPHKYRN